MLKITNKTISETSTKDLVLEFPDPLLTTPKCPKCYFNMETFFLRYRNGKIYMKHVCRNCLFSMKAAYIGDVNQAYLDEFLKENKMITIKEVSVSIDSDGTQEDQEEVLDFVAKLRNLILVDSDQFCKVDVFVKNKIVPALAEINIKGVENGN